MAASKRDARRKIKTGIYAGNIRQINASIRTGTKAIQDSMAIITEHKNAHFLTPLLIYLSIIMLQLNRIQTAIVELDEIIQSHRCNDIETTE